MSNKEFAEKVMKTGKIIDKYGQNVFVEAFGKTYCVRLGGFSNEPDSIAKMIKQEWELSKE